MYEEDKRMFNNLQAVRHQGLGTRKVAERLSIDVVLKYRKVLKPELKINSFTSNISFSTFLEIFTWIFFNHSLYFCFQPKLKFNQQTFVVSM